MISAVVFDMGDIFFDATPWRRWLAAHMQSLDIPISYEQLCKEWEEQLVPVYLGQRTYWDTFAAYISMRVTNQAQARAVISKAQAKALDVEKRVLFPEVAATLKLLNQRGVRLAVLSDTESPEHRVRQRLQSMLIEEYFSAVITSIDIGFVKPQLEAYLAAMEKLHVTPGESAFVGHDEDELDGAMKAGMTVVAYNSQVSKPGMHQIHKFSELFDVVLN